VTRPKRLIWLLLAAALLPSLAFANGASEAFTRTTLLLIVLITMADWCGFLFEYFGLPELVGEIFAGILLGNLALFGLDYDVGEMLRTSEFMQYSSELAVVLLLFLVGLESNISDLLKVGRNATFVAVTGVVLPVGLGITAGSTFNYASGIEAWFMGAMLAATSVGITAKFLGERGLIKTPSAQVILGAAVIDDVLGILLLAVLASIVVTGDFSFAELGWIIAKAIGFFVVAIFSGRLFLPNLIKIASLNKHSSFWAGFALCIALGSAQLAAFAGLAPLIGAFVAGLLFDEVYFVTGKKLQKHTLAEMLKPLSDILLTVFFVGIGSQVQLETLVDSHALILISTLFVVAIISKGAAGFTVSGKGFDRLGIGIGMVPRGEVGLVFASFAYAQGVFDTHTFSALIIVVLLSTIAGPILLKPRLKFF